MESFSAPNRWQYFETLPYVDWVGKRTLMYCSEDVFCGAYAANGSDPISVLQSIEQQASEGTFPCINSLPPAMAPDGDWLSTFQSMFGALMGLGVRDPMSFVGPLLYRFQRCSEDDVAAIVHMWNQFFNSSNSPSTFPISSSAIFSNASTACGISQVVLYNLFLSEGVQNPPPPSIGVMAAQVNTQLFSAPFSIMSHARELWDAWPRYAWDEYVHQYPQTTIPILFFNGDLDISTPWSNAAFTAIYYNASTQTLIRLPQVPHVGLLQSPLKNSPLTCGLVMATEFFLSGGSTVNTSCVADIQPLDWRENTTSAQQISMQLFGTPDAWGL